MCLFKFRKTKAEKNLKDRELIEKNANAISVLIAMAHDDELKQNLSNLQEELRYITPMTTSDAYDVDRKIENLIGDLKIELSKDKDSEKFQKKVNDLVEEIRVKMVERKALI